jgi:hypothetical protein
MTKKTTNTIGAPIGNKNAAKPAAKKSTAVIFLRLTASEKEAVEMQAALVNMKPTAWVRQIVLNAARGVE